MLTLGALLAGGVTAAPARRQMGPPPVQPPARALHIQSGLARIVIYRFPWSERRDGLCRHAWASELWFGGAFTMAEILPAIFFGHGNPMNALMTNNYTEAWRQIGIQTPRPRGILAISAHWFVPGTGVTISTAPRTIHDFGGFPHELFEVQYPAPGAPDLARRVQRMLVPLQVQLDHAWGLDQDRKSTRLNSSH